PRRPQRDDALDTVFGTVGANPAELLRRAEADGNHLAWRSRNVWVTAARFGFSSTPAKRIPSRSAQRAVMPFPQQGSKTIAPGRATLDRTCLVIATPDIPVGLQSVPGPEYQSMFGRFGLPYKQRQRARSWSPRRAMASASSSTHRSPISTNTCARGAFTAATTSQKVSRNRAQSGRTDSPLWVRQYIRFPGPQGGSE